MPDFKALVSHASPFARKVRVTIRECALTDRVEEISVANTALNQDPTVVAANPLGKIPALVPADGVALSDSRVITRYLSDLSGQDFYPQDRIWEVLTLESLADGLTEAAVLMAYEHRLRPPEYVFEPWVEAQWNKVARTVAEIEANWMPALSGPLDAAQIAVGCGLGYLDFRHDARQWRDGAPALAEWYATFAERPSMAATVPA